MGHGQRPAIARARRRKTGPRRGARLWLPRHACGRLLRIELAATHAYGRASQLVKAVGARHVLWRNFGSHALRSRTLAHRLEALGAVISPDVGATARSYAALIDSGMALLGEHAVLETLQLVERQVSGAYRSELARMQTAGLALPALARWGQVEQAATERDLRALRQGDRSTACDELRRSWAAR